MNDKIAKGMIEKMVATDTKPTYASLKRKEEELLIQLKELREEIAKAENDIIEEKLDIAIKCLTEVDGMTHSYHRCPIEVYCDGCEETIEADIDLVEIINALQRVR